TRFLECVHPDDQQRLAHTLRQAVNAVNHYSIEFRIIWPDGSIRWLEAHGRPTPDVTGTVVCVNGVMRDITGRKYAELAMQETHTNALSDGWTNAQPISRMPMPYYAHCISRLAPIMRHW
ncbi:MAG: PAS domain-containing protein, partial [Chloroflexaceae bacterium]|nr:PAS domain-containing protein [Chloroflexaceae bacterium]